MRFLPLARLIRAFVPLALLVAASAAGWAQSGTLQQAAPQPPSTPPKPPQAAPRVPVTKAAPPVVHAQPSAHAQKPPAKPAAAPAPPVPPVAPIVAPTVAPVPATPPPSAKPADAEKETESRPVPRFQSLRSNEVNLRAGPGQRYRIDWVYKRTDLPVKVEREFEHWRLIRDADDIQGWVNQATLTSRRGFIVKGGDATLRDDPKESAAAVAILQPGVIGRIRSCAKESAWCKVQVAGHNGYLRRTQFFGTLPDEEIAP